MLLPGHQNNQQILLFGRCPHNEIVCLPGQYNKNVCLASVSDAFAIRLKALLSSGIMVRGDTGNVFAATEKTVQTDAKLHVRGNFVQDPARYAILGSAIVGEMTLGIMGCCRKSTSSSVGVSLVGTAKMNSSKHIEITGGFGVQGTASQTLCWCVTGSNGVTIATSASCTQFRLRRLGDLSGNALADMASISLQEFYYAPYVSPE